MRPIKTWYDGNLYASLLEARWAVFFDNAGIPFEYEYVGYKLGELAETWYLPDFWLPEQKLWVEVKPHSDFVGTDIKKITHFELALQKEYLAERKAGEKATRKQFYVFVGSPYFNGKRHTYDIFTIERSDLDKKFRIPIKSASELELTASNHRWMHCPLCERLQVAYGFGQVRDLYDKADEERLMCLYCHEETTVYDKESAQMNFIWCDGLYVSTGPGRLGYILGSPRLMRGYKAAREFKAPRKGSS